MSIEKKLPVRSDHNLSLNIWTKVDVANHVCAIYSINSNIEVSLYYGGVDLPKPAG